MATLGNLWIPCEFTQPVPCPTCGTASTEIGVLAESHQEARGKDKVAVSLAFTRARFQCGCVVDLPPSEEAVVSGDSGL